ncbi:hypothetical protein L596_020718 [Steinernema carpocapsae]|uniref:Peptidase S1 domain-containing protein n=1 Tax=Steinernema carpocapsae TaxID=34508 RepID=A0A4U5MUD4_STECR|nr:hypothetical protein L596_020718 [Steinernema carpocapsae]
MWIFLAFLCLWALFSCTAAFPIQDDEFKIDSNFSQGIGKPSPFPADPYELFNMVHFSYPELVFGEWLSTTHAVTAGHCTFNMIAAEIMVGSTTSVGRNANAQWRKIVGVYTHPGHNPNVHPIRDDIGIVKFSPAITLNKNVQLAKIVANDSQLLQSSRAFISGFGAYTW